MNKTERLVRQYLRKSCDDGSSLSPDIRFVCKNGKSFAHKFALLSRLPDLGKLFCELCLNGHDQVDIILDDVTKEEVEEARDFLYMYGDAESFAKIFGMMKTKDEIIEKLTKNLSSEAKITKIENKKEIEKKVNLDSVNMPISKSTSTLLSRFGSNTIIRTKSELNKPKELEKKSSPKKLRSSYPLLIKVSVYFPSPMYDSQSSTVINTFSRFFHVGYSSSFGAVKIG